jgi:photosystem II stability/assembly factor-like uncharacterized protein
MLNKINILKFSVLFLLWHCQLSFADVSTYVNFQGMLTDNNNKAVEEGTYTITFSIWDGENTDSNKLWEETHALFVSRGIYSVLLGTVHPFDDQVSFSSQYYFGVQVGDSLDYLTQNGKFIPLTSAWSSFRAKTCSGKLIRSVDQDYTLTTNDDYLFIQNDSTITLPVASSLKGRLLTLKKMDINHVITIKPFQTDTINGNSSEITLTRQFDEIELISTGDHWLITGVPTSAIKELELMISTKSNHADIYTRTYIDNTINAAITDITNTLQQKADIVDIYTKTYIDNTINAAITDITNTLQQKADIVDIYTRTYIDNTINAAITDITNTLQQKADIVDIYTRTYIDNTINAAITDITNTLQQKADADNYYNKTYIDSALSTKLNTSTYNAGISLKADISDIYTSGKIDTLLNQKLDNSDAYTRSYLDQMLESKADAIQYTNLSQMLDSKADAIQYSTLIDQKAFTIDIYTRTYLNDQFSQYSQIISQKAEHSDIYTRQYIDNALTGISVGGDMTAAHEFMENALDMKANVSDTYTRDYLNTLLSEKSDRSNSYTRQYLDDIISQKADTSTTLTRTHIYETFSTKADVYTRTYLDEKLSLLTWKEVTSDSYTITANENYIVNSTNQVTLSMPDTQNLNFGDILSISALGSGGWKINPPEGQTIQLGNKVIYRNSSTGEIWRERTNAGSHDWSCLDISSDGRYMSAAVSFGNIYMSSNYGESWISYSFDTLKDWVGLALSDDGQNMTIVPTLDYIMSTNDGGSTWLTRTIAGQQMWRDISGSPDGSHLIACVGGTSGDRYIQTSSDYGATWTTQLDAGSHNWKAVAASTDFIRVAACVTGTSGDRYIYTSSDSGYIWKERTNSGSRNWNDIAMSSDGTFIVAVVYGGYIYTSNDSGLNWTEQSSAGNRYWLSVAISADNSTILASCDGGIYQSLDNGANWTSLIVDSQNYKSVDMASDASVYAAAVGGATGNRYIMTSQSEYSPLTQINASSTIPLSGKQYESARLQYIGNDTYTLLESDATSSLNYQNGNVGIGTSEPQRTLHVKDVFRLEPRVTEPDNPSAGDMYFDANTKKLKVFDGDNWKACW